MILKDINSFNLMSIAKNYSKIERELKWKLKTKIEQGIIETISYYKKYYKFLKIR